MLQEEKIEKRKKDKEEIQKRFADVERRQAEEREADRERKLISSRLLGRESILGALSRSLSFNVRISYSLRHVRSNSNTTLACSMHMPVQLFL